MGWWGIVFKDDISRVSDSLAVGLTTGYLGSLTTYSGWNQKMLGLSAQGKWVVVVFGFPLGNGICFYLFILTSDFATCVACGPHFVAFLVWCLERLTWKTIRYLEIEKKQWY